MPGASDVAEMFATARQHHQAGRLSEAEQLYRRILAIDPRHADSLHLLGVTLLQTGNLDLAIDLISQAIAINPDVAAYHSNLGNAHQARGRLNEAVACFQRALSLRPTLADAHNNLGNALHELGRPDEAIDCFRRALDLRPDYPEAHNNLGHVLRRLGRLEEAAVCFRGALHQRPAYPEALNNLGSLHQQQGRPEAAAACFRQALELRPNDPEALNNLGDLLRQQGRTEQAIICFRRALEQRPNDPEAHNNLGAMLREQGLLDEAVTHLRHATELRPDYPEAHYNLGNALRLQNELVDATVHYRAAAGLRADFPEAHNNLGNVLQQQGRLDEAAASCREALRLRPDYPEAEYNLGNALLKLWRLDEAAASFRHAIALRPEFSDAYNNLGNVRKEQGQLHEALEHYQQALRIQPESFLAYSSLLFAQNYLAHEPADSLRDLARQFGHLASSHAQQPFAEWRDPQPGRPLRIGLVSGDLGNHPVGYFLEGLLRAADPSRVAFLAFPTQRGEDDLTARIKPCFEVWQPIHALDDAAAARLIHTSGVQVLLDLAGHTAHNRLPLFAWRPAPVQASWLGYFATTGIAEMDYIIGDPQVAPPAEANQFTETIWRLPETYLCFTPPAIAVEGSELPAQSNGYVTFGCCNNLSKINDRVVAVWAHVLHAVAGSRLLLKAFQLRDPTVRDSIRTRFAALGISGERLLTEPPSSRADYLRTWHRVDIALDPFPYPGGTTTAEALWMGVPVLTKRGNRFLSHAGESILRNAGLPDWIAGDDDAYVSMAECFAADVGQLATLRTGLRDRVLASPLFDAPRFAGHFQAAMWEMWRRRSAKA